MAEDRKVPAYLPALYVNDGAAQTDDFADFLLFGAKASFLVVGNVQSGKTRYIKVKAFEAIRHGVDIAVVLTAGNNELRQQTITELRSQLPRNSSRASVYDISELHYTSFTEKKLIIVCLKVRQNIEKLESLINSSKGLKYAIFDDESDFASIDTSKEGEEKTLIHNKLRGIYEGNDHVLFFAVTATPYADILSKSAFKFSKLIKMPPSPGYCGFKEFREIGAYEAFESKKGIVYGKKLWEVVYDHAKRTAASNLESSQLLLNSSSTNDDHNEQIKEIKALLQDVANFPSQYYVKKEDNDSGRDLCKDFSRLSLPSMTTREIKIAIEVMERVYPFNQNSASKWKKKTGFHELIVGGALISRGYAFPAPLTCLLVNIPTGLISADAHAQKARWLGYREDFIKWMKIYMPKSSIEAYREIEELNDIVHSSKTVQEVSEKVRTYMWKLIVPTRKAKKC